MAALAHPHEEDVIICRRSSTFTIGVRSGIPQILCGTFEEALQRAGTFATGRHVNVWFMTDDREFVRLGNDRLLRRMWAEYIAMPGLRLTSRQAQRLWAVDEDTCSELLESLVKARLLARGADGRYAYGVDRPAQLSQTRMARAEIPSESVPPIRQAS